MCLTTPTSNSSSQHKHKKSMFFLRVGRGGKFCFLCVSLFVFATSETPPSDGGGRQPHLKKVTKAGTQKAVHFFIIHLPYQIRQTPVAVLDTDRQPRRIASLPIDRNTAPVVSKYVSGIRRTDVHRCVPRRAIDRRLTLTTSRRINFHAVATGLTFVLTLTE